VRGRRRLRTAFLLGAGLLATAVVVAAWGFGLLDRAELDSVDARFALRGEQPAPSDVVVVAIDEESFDRINRTWPFPRSLHANVIDRLMEAGAAVVLYDVQFTERTEVEQDDALIRAVRRAGDKVVLGTEDAPVLGGLDVPTGNFLVPVDEDGVNRRLPYSVGGMESMAVAGVEAATGERANVDRFGHRGAWIDFRGPPGTIRTVPFWQVESGEARSDLFRDRIVVVGAAAPSLQDLHATSAGRLMSGPELQANAAWTVKAGLPLRSSPGPANVLLVALLGLLYPVLAVRLRPAPAFLLGLLGAIAYGGLALLAFTAAGLIFPVAAPLAAFALALTATLGVAFATAALERERTREMFARFVPAGVVDEVLAAADGDLLAAKRVQCTVVFADLRSFTPWAEMLPAEQVLEVLNRYCEEMTGAVEAHGGTIVGFSGDGVIAVFGAPLELPDHADRALGAVREMAGERIERLNRWVQERKLGDGFRVGIGVNSGIVMSGNVGSQQRLEYTVIGDVPNTAARLEGMTKDLECSVLVSDATRAMLREDAPDLDYVDAATVRGKTVKVGLWTLRSSSGRR
jgi:adenylate cyclase